MKHPFETTHLSASDIEQVTGAAGQQTNSQSLYPDSMYRPSPLPPPAYITLALGEDGGEYPFDDFV